MKLPSVVAHHIRGTQPRNMTLRGSNNKLWRLKIEKHGEDWYFTDGWRAFKKDIGNAKGDMLEFKYVTRSLLDVHLRVSGCEGGDELPERPEVVADVVVAEEENPDDEAEDVQANSGNRQTRMRIDYYGSDVFASGQIPRPINHYFVTEIRKARQHELYIPRYVIKDFKIELPEEIMVVDSRGRCEPIKRKMWSGRRIVYNGGGWRVICKKNFARHGDKVICEFVRPDTGDLRLSITVVHSDNI